MNLSDETMFKNIKNFKQEWYFYFNRLLELSISMFEWQNVPDTIDTRFLEWALFWDGDAVFFKDEEIGYLALQCTIGGELNVYRIPIMRNAYATNGYNRELNINNSVIIFNNLIHTNCLNEVLLFSQRLYDIDNTIGINVNAQKTPLFISCDERQRLTLKNLYMKYQGNTPVIFGDKNLKPNAIQVMQTNAPFIADKLSDLKSVIWNEALTYLGISNVNIQKRERLLRDEVTRNMGGAIASRYSRLEARRNACREINKMFGLNLWCDYRKDVELIAEDMQPTTDGKEEEKNAHDDNDN